MKYLVPVVYRGQANFLVEADLPTEAQYKAVEAFAAGDEPTVCGNEWETAEHAGQPEAAPTPTFPPPPTASAEPAPTTLPVHTLKMVLLEQVIALEPDVALASAFREMATDKISFGDADYTLVRASKLIELGEESGTLTETIRTHLQAAADRGDLIGYEA